MTNDRVGLLIGACYAAAFVWIFAIIIRDAARENRRRLREWARGPLPIFSGYGRIRLQPGDLGDWAEPDRAGRLAGEFLALGFLDEGPWSAELPDGRRVWLFVDPAGATHGAIIELGEASPRVALTIRSPDGRRVVATDRPADPSTRTPPGDTVHRLPGGGVGDLRAALQGAWPAGDVRVPAVVGGSAADYAEWYARDADWRNLHGALAEAEVRAQAALEGVEDFGDDEVERFLVGQARVALLGLREALYHRFFEALPAGEPDALDLRQAQLRFIHDRTPVEEVAAAFRLSAADAYDVVTEPARGGLEDPWLDRQEALPRAGLTPRGLFALLNDDRRWGRRYERCGEVDRPLPADVYRARRAGGRRVSTLFRENR